MGGPAGAGSCKCWPEASVTGIPALQTPGEVEEEQRLLQELHLALGRALRLPPVLVEPWEAGASLSSVGRGQVIPIQIL